MGIKKIYVDIDIRPGETIKVVTGSFAGLIGIVEDVNAEKQMLTAKIEMFGRETPVDLEFSQVDKL